MNGHSMIENDDWPQYAVIITDVGTNRSKVFSLLRETLQLDPAATKSLMEQAEIEVARGPRMEVEPVFERFRSIDAKVTMRAVSDPERIELKDLLATPARFHDKAAAVEGHLVVTHAFSYLASAEDAARGILVQQPRLEHRMLQQFPVMAGSLVTYSDRAVVEGVLLASTGLPMFPVMVHPVVAVTFFFGDWEPVRMEFGLTSASS